MKLIIRVKYDGGAYHGFQYQPNFPTVQGTLTETASKVMGFPCLVTGCSRTDAGVHAFGYCASVEPADEHMKCGEWCPVPVNKVDLALNSALPADISVTGAVMAGDFFHPRYSAVSKEYVYMIHDGRCHDPFARSYAYEIRRSLSDGDISQMNQAAARLSGMHDFSSFMASGSKVSDTIRTLKLLRVERISGDKLSITARADGFLYNMVRILAGTLLEVAYGKISSGEMEKILDSHDRSRAGFTAPAHGLYLKSVDYGTQLSFDDEGSHRTSGF